MEIDVSRWAVIRDEPGGRDPNKRWLAIDPDSPRDQHWLWKSRQTTGDGSQAALTDCAEVCVSRLANVLQIPAATCRFAVCDGELGVVSRNVTPAGFTLNTARTYLPEIEGYEQKSIDAVVGEGVHRMRRETGYTLDAVERVLSAVAPPPGVQDISAFGVFAGYLTLDALVGNTDRHPGNWALLESDEDGRRFLAPTYDHGSALGAGLTDENRRLRSPEAFAAKGFANPFSPSRQKLVNLAMDAVHRADATVWLERIADLDATVVEKALEAPDRRLSEVASTFMKRVILENRRRLCDVDAAED